MVVVFTFMNHIKILLRTEGIFEIKFPKIKDNISMMSWVYRMWNSSHHYITNPILDMGNDAMLPKLAFDKPLDIQLNWNKLRQESQCLPGDLIRYTDGSRKNTNTGSGIYCESSKCKIDILKYILRYFTGTVCNYVPSRNVCNRSLRP